MSIDDIILNFALDALGLYNKFNEQNLSGFHKQISKRYGLSDPDTFIDNVRVKTTNYVKSLNLSPDQEKLIFHRKIPIEYIDNYFEHVESKYRVKMDYINDNQIFIPEGLTRPYDNFIHHLSILIYSNKDFEMLGQLFMFVETNIEYILDKDVEYIVELFDHYDFGELNQSTEDIEKDLYLTIQLGKLQLKELFKYVNTLINTTRNANKYYQSNITEYLINEIKNEI